MTTRFEFYTQRYLTYRSRIHGSHVLDVNQLFSKSQVQSIKYGTVGHVLGEERNSILSAVSLNIRKIEVVNEHD
jgi:hypothetical protein